MSFLCLINSSTISIIFCTSSELTTRLAIFVSASSTAIRKIANSQSANDKSLHTFLYLGIPILFSVKINSFKTDVLFSKYYRI